MTDQTLEVSASNYSGMADAFVPETLFVFVKEELSFLISLSLQEGVVF